ncbi:Uncharacterised protein [Escherichia coli]|uniref:Uncharacterized protein n=1 Tax=Escherichia coli TaxID=562 RepID=A0A376UF49_ECOLX|nr:Uncharacterised protein [Escherichia coli]
MVQKKCHRVRWNKTVAAAPVGIELCRPLPDVGACNSLHRLGLAVLMVIGHTSDVDPYALYRRVFFRTLGITPPESDLKTFRHSDAAIPGHVSTATSSHFYF